MNLNNRISSICVGLVDGATGKLLLLFVCLFVCLHVVYVVTEFVRYRDHMDTELSCHVPTGTKRWYFNSEQSSGYQPITAENGALRDKREHSRTQ